MKGRDYMNTKFKKLLCAVLSAAMVAGTVILPTIASADEWSADAGSWKFDFGSTDNVADGYIGVSATDQYNANKGYGLLGLEDGYAVDRLADSYEMTQGYDLVLENGARDTVLAADDDFVACTYDETVGNTGMVSPVRFAMKSPESTYYNVKIKLQRADVSKEARVTLTTERRHQHLLDYPIPAEGLEYECNVYVHNWQDKKEGEKHDTMLNIAALGENVAISSIEVTKPAQAGKTLFVLSDSTGCEQTAAIPYFPLDHCQGVGSALAKYLGKDWALVNEAQSGLASRDSINHFGNCKNHIKAGDVVWFQFGHNDDKVSNDPATNGYISTLENYYDEITKKDASLVVVSPIERKQQSQYNETTKEFGHSLNHYSVAGKAFVDAKIEAGATNIAFIDLNECALTFLNEVHTEINDKYNYGWKSANFYYFNTDYTHPNDYGADNFAYEAVNEANRIIAAAEAADADANTKAQADVLSALLDGQRELQPNRVSEDIYKLGLVPNSAYPKALTKVVYYDFPWLLTKVVWNEDGTAKQMNVKPVDCQSETIPFSYCKGVIEVYNADGTLKDKINTTDGEFLDRLNGDGTLTFTDTDIKYDESAGETYKAYLVDSDIGTTYTNPVSNTLTEKDNIDIKEYLIQGGKGTENIEDFSSYSSEVATGESVLGKGGWSSAGNVTAVMGKDGDTCYAAVKKEDQSQSHYLFKNLTKEVSTGKLYLNFDIRYKDGTISIEFTDGSKAPNNFPPLHMPLVIKNSGGEVGVYLGDELVSTINTNSWTNITYTLDFERELESASVNGKTKERTVGYLNSDTPSPAKLKAFAIVETTKKVGIEYDITNITIATVDNSPLPQYILSVDTDTSEGGTVKAYEGAPTDAELTYDGTNAVVTASKAISGKLIEAKYVDGVLSEVIPTDVTLTEAGSKLVSAAAGSKLMLWNSLEGMKPLAPAITAEAVTYATEITAALKTVVTAQAVPNDGYAFMGWYDGTTKVSDNAAYTFKIKADTDLKAKFVKEATVADITQFELSAKEYVKAVSGATVTMSIINAKDAQNAPVSKVTNEDVAWACNETGVTVDNKGVVTFDSDFSAGEDGVKKITIEGTLNEIKKTYTITAHLADYYEDFAKAAGTTIVDPGQTNGIVSNSNNPYSHLAVSVGGDNGSGGNITPIAAGNNFGYYSAGYNRDNYSLTFNPDKTISKFRTDAVFGAQTWAGGGPTKRGTDKVTLTIGNLTIVATPSNMAETATSGTDALTVTVSDGTTTKTAESALKQLGWAKYEIEVGENNAVTVKITPNGGTTETLTGFSLSAAATKAVFSGSKTASFGLDNVEIFYAE